MPVRSPQYRRCLDLQYIFRNPGLSGTARSLEFPLRTRVPSSIANLKGIRKLEEEEMREDGGKKRAKWRCPLS